MVEVLREITKASDSTLWHLLGKVAEQLKAELDASHGDNSKVWFWYELYKSLEKEIDTRIAQEG